MQHPANRASSLFAATLLAAVCAASVQPARAQGAGCAEVEVKNVRPQQGHLMVAAYADAESFLKKPLVALRLPAGDETMRFQLCGLKGDIVALTLFQDLDSDGKMSRNLVGMPTEPWGGSGTPGSFGPSWDSNKVALDGKLLAVRMSL